MSFFISEAAASAGAPAQGSPYTMGYHACCFCADLLFHDFASTAKTCERTP